MLFQMGVVNNAEWLLCSACGNKKRLRMRKDTELKNFPLYCPKCKKEILIEVTNLQVAVITEADTLDAEPVNV